MKNIQFVFFALLTGLFLVCSCAEDVEVKESSSLWFGNGPEFIFEDDTFYVDVADTFTIQVIADNGTDNLSMVTFNDDSVQIDTSNINSSILSIESLSSGTKYNDNPLLLSEADQKGFTSTWVFIAKEPSQPEDSIINTYSFTLEDQEGQKRSISLDLLILPDTTITDTTTLEE